ncbi:MAG: hypothetical protein GY798_10525 [Hyphomicrobiales bacterium]|nr:hypothetical protein [Hyphomicrobiales bacterium]
MLRPVAGNVGELLDPLGVGPGGEIAIMVVMLIVVAFFAGLVGLTYVGRGVVDWLETTLLNRVPGYKRQRNLPYVRQDCR